MRLVKRSQPSELYKIVTGVISVPDDLNTEQFAVQAHSDRVILGEEYDRAFYIGASDFDYQVFQRMDTVGVKLADFGLRAQTGKIQFDRYEEYALSAKADGACRLIWAENVQRYTLAPTVRRTGKEWLKESVTDLAPPSITGQGIITQRVTANEQPRRIIATLLNPTHAGTSKVYSENHTNFIPVPENNHAIFILAALNSSPVEFIFRRLNSNTQVSAGEINSLPFPPLPEHETLTEICTLVSDLMDFGGALCTSTNSEKALKNEQRLDLLIGSLYGLSPDEVGQIWATLPPHRSVQTRGYNDGG